MIYFIIFYNSQVCSKTLEAEIYDPIQNKMKNLIQVVSTLSLAAGKYLYGELFKRKKIESFVSMSYLIMQSFIYNTDIKNKNGHRLNCKKFKLILTYPLN